ncbi:hypothetical protein [Candidatus Formimonas warabiya]|uniref:Uncharacterized protein n=1 Tax=Formimonas warabiya TaxID=1761012 RepID=A0A3G1KT07_FORW1|nr:hypothetical protein [Candidatus Formimonas warabiya]ATW25560.1 hypothetical protein DCMF_13045 [Candidatus Formimonas warabiya]
MPEIKTTWKKHLRPRNILGLIFIILIALSITVYLQSTMKIVPEEVLQSSISNTLAANAYRFHTKSTITIEGENKVFSDISGERADADTFHVTGSMLGTSINVFQIKDTTYRMDPVTQKWIITENNSLLRESLLMAELNPLSNFYFKELISATYLGKEKINRRNMYKIECVPRIQNKWLDGYFKNLKYTIWIDKKDRFIKKAQVTALSKEKESSSLTVDVELFDYNKKIEIKAPVL